MRKLLAALARFVEPELYFLSALLWGTIAFIIARHVFHWI